MASGVSRKRLEEHEGLSVKRKIIEPDDAVVDAVAQDVIEQAKEQPVQPSQHEYVDLGQIQHKIMLEVEQILTNKGVSENLIDCEYALWIHQIASHPSFPAHRETLHHIYVILESELQKCFQTYKKNLPDSGALQDQISYSLQELRYNIGVAFLSRLSGFLSPEGKEAALEAAARESAVEVIKILLENGPVSEEVKKQVFNWSIDQGCQEIFLCLAKQICGTRQARTEAMWVALNAGRFDMLEPIFSFGPIAEKDRQEAIAKTREVGIPELLILLKSSRSKLIAE